jgi:hypothetical protein
MRAVFILGLMGVGTLLGGCAGRLANPQPVDSAFDKYYTCQDIRAEKDRINQAFLDRNVEQASLKQRDDELMTRTIPLLLLPGVGAIQETRASGSAKSPQQVEIDALKARDAHLDGMAADRGC